MWYIKEILKASVCSFCETVYEYTSLEKMEFIEGVKKFLNEYDLDECLNICTDGIVYDIENIDNIYKEKLCYIKNNRLEEEMIIEKCDTAFSKTICVDKTINVEAFVDNIAEELKK